MKKLSFTARFHYPYCNEIILPFLTSVRPFDKACQLLSTVQFTFLHNVNMYEYKTIILELINIHNPLIFFFCLCQTTNLQSLPVKGKKLSIYFLLLQYLLVMVLYTNPRKTTAPNFANSATIYQSHCSNWRGPACRTHVTSSSQLSNSAKSWKPQNDSLSKSSVQEK